MAEICEAYMEGLAFGGAAFGRLPDGMLCFVRGAIPGERIRLEVTARKKSYARGRIREILESSPLRISPACPLAVTPQNAGCDCQGCSYQHLPYDLELTWKQKQFEGFLLRPGLVSPERMLPPFPAPERYHWRNRIALSCTTHSGKKGPGARSPSAGILVLGYRAEDNKTILPVSSCMIARKALDTAIREISDCTGTEEGKSFMISGKKMLIPSAAQRVFFRWTLKDGVCVWTDQDPPSGTMLTEQLGSAGRFLVHRESFFQTNTAVACELLRRTAETVRKLQPEAVLELFCGAGIFSIIAAESCENCTCFGIELDRRAISAARRNAEKRGLEKRCRFHCGDASSFRSVFSQEHRRQLDADKLLLILDPPRSGLTKRQMKEILSLRSGHILYISCSPDTLKRDLESLTAPGNNRYEIVQTGILDMFPATAHFESMTLLRRT